MDLSKLKAEEKELEELMYGKEEKPEATEVEAPSTEEEDETEFEPTEVIVQDLSEASPSPPKKTRVSWKKRYVNYKSSTDSTIYSLRQEKAALSTNLADALEEVSRLKVELNTLKLKVSSTKDPLDGIITKEDRELIGDEAADIIAKVAKTNSKDDPRVDELQKQVEDFKKEKIKKLRAEKDKLRLESQGTLKDGLMKLVPSFESIDNDPEFHDYLSGVDEVSGVPRSTLFISAVNSRDVYGSARFYREFEDLRPKTREQILAAKVTPSGEGSSLPVEDAGAKETYHIKQYERFMDDVAKGRYKGRKDEAVLIENKFDKAFMEGRIYE